jgi:hypothetical protein
MATQKYKIYKKNDSFFVEIIRTEQIKIVLPENVDAYIHCTVIKFNENTVVTTSDYTFTLDMLKALKANK